MTETYNDEHQFAEKMEQEYQRIRDEITKPRILVLGATGCGKSSLVNKVFGETVADVGVGAPVTQGVARYETETVCIYDSEGYESGSENQKRYRDEIVGFLDSGKVEEKPHIAWYCISYASHRILDVDRDLIQKVKDKSIPVCVIFTQADMVSEDESHAMIDALNQSALDVPYFELSMDPALELTPDDAIDWSYEYLDQAARHAFAASVKASIPIKWKQSKKIIATHCSTAAAAGASPIPGSDTPILTGNQMTMLARLVSVWNLKEVRQIVNSQVIPIAASNIGRTMAGNVLKWIPGAGTVAGSVINASVASALTGAIGYGVSEICERIIRARLRGEDINVEDFFNAKNIMEAVARNYSHS